MTEQQLIALQKQYHVPAHILRHMQKVAEVGVFLAQKIMEHGEKVDIELVRQGALLHDLVKLCDFTEVNVEFFEKPHDHETIEFWKAYIKKYPEVGHEQQGGKILDELGEPVLAEIVKRHGFTALITPGLIPETWEQKIVYYADKRVKHDQLVSVQERIKDGNLRYFPDGNIPSHHTAVVEKLYHLELEICSKARIKPEAIAI